MPKQIVPINNKLPTIFTLEVEGNMEIETATLEEAKEKVNQVPYSILFYFLSKAFPFDVEFEENNVKFKGKICLKSVQGKDKCFKS